MVTGTRLGEPVTRPSHYDSSQSLVTTYEYTFNGKVAKMTEPEGLVTTYAYDSRGRLVRTTDGAGNTTELEYGAGASGCSSCPADAGSADQPSVIDYPTFTREIDYDSRGRKIAERDNVQYFSHIFLK